MRKSKLSLTTVAATMVSALALGLGIVVPNGEIEEEGQPHQWYAKEDKDLVRYDCPAGTVPTQESCIERRASLGNYDRILTSLSNEISGTLSTLETEIKAETTALKEADPKTKSLRALVVEYNESLADKEEEEEALLLKKAKTEKNLGLVKNELEKIDNELKNNPSGEALTRLLAAKKLNLELRTRYTSERVSLLKALDSNAQAKEEISGLIDSTNVELERYLKNLKVSSVLLSKLTKKQALMEEESGLVSELEARLKSSIACHMASWEEPGAPELFARLLRHIEKCKLEGPKQGNPTQGNPNQGKPKQ